jgi:hypothetical protein
VAMRVATVATMDILSVRSNQLVSMAIIVDDHVSHAFPADKSLHFWVEGIASDISQMFPLALPSDLLDELFLLFSTLLGSTGQIIRGKSGLLLQIVENAMAGSVIAELCSQRDLAS